MKRTEGITAAAGILAAGIFLSRLLGYGRELLLSWKFGAGAQTDAFYAAFQIPDILNYFLAGGALSIAFIPLYNKARAREGEAAAQDLYGVVLGSLGAAVIVATALLYYYAPALVAFQFPKFNAETMALTVELTRIVLPAQVFFITGGIVQAVLLARKHFVASALAPLVYNICTIAGGWALYGYCGIKGFAYGTLVGSALGPFLVPMLFSRWQEGFSPFRISLSLRDRRFLGYLVLAAPLMLGQTLLTLDEWYGRWFGALLDEGNVAHISYARRLVQVPVALIGQAVAAAALPTLSLLWAEKRVDEMNATLARTLRVALFLAVLAAAAICAVSGPIVSLFYEQGAFTAQDALTVGGLIALLAFAIPGWIMQQIAARGFYARGDTLRPMALGTVLALAVIPLYLWLSGRIGVSGIALAGAVGMTLNALATILFMSKVHNIALLRPLGESFMRSMGIAALSGGAAWWVSGMIPVQDLPLKLAALLQIGAGGVAFCIIGIPLFLSAGDEEARAYALKALRKIFPQK